VFALMGQSSFEKGSEKNQFKKKRGLYTTLDI